MLLRLAHLNKAFNYKSSTPTFSNILFFPNVSQPRIIYLTNPYVIDSYLLHISPNFVENENLLYYIQRMGEL